MWGRGQRGNNVTCWVLIQLSVTSPTAHKQIGPFWCWFPGGWACVHSRAPWFSPVNSPVRLGVYPAPETPTDFYSQRFWGSSFPHWIPRLCSLSCSPVLPPGLCTLECWNSQSATLLYVLSAGLPVSTPPTSLDECFFFNSSDVGLPYSSIFWQF